MPEDAPDSSPSTPPAWASYGKPGEDEDFIVGSHAGLQALRDHIDQAVQTGECHIEDPHIEFNGIRCKQSIEEVPEESLLSKLAGYGCFGLVLALIGFAIYGFICLFR